MQPVERRCASCSKVAGRSRRNCETIDHPFDERPTCGGFCGQFVSHVTFEDWILMGPSARMSYVASGTTFALTLGLLPARASACSRSPWSI